MICSLVSFDARGGLRALNMTLLGDLLIGFKMRHSLVICSLVSLVTDEDVVL